MTPERFRNVLLGICVIAWGYFAWLGYGKVAVLSALRQAHIPQVVQYFVIPASLTIEALFALIYRLREPVRRLDWWLVGVPVILLPIYVLTLA